jgi:hypothetical protein
VLDIVVDTAEKYPYTFAQQQASTVRRRLSAGDYAVQVGDEIVAAVERKTLADLAASLMSGRMTYAAAELMTLPRAAVVVEDRYSRLFKLDHVKGARAAEALAELQARFPALPVTFCESRPLAQEWTYRWLGACLHEWESARATSDWETSFATAPPVAPADVDADPPPPGGGPRLGPGSGNGKEVQVVEPVIMFSSPTGPVVSAHRAAPVVRSTANARAT